ncbi:hypothetical protein B0T20DRAFT_195541 [Sordaria brevicollis]|uniref:Secreted protein n=1 Tax=Sordaria brevicollis TaxID=83679 RepID=A0AAE0UDA7_SORBR|nr:hypothetical protein B0T20DRAFT_195541 [Sordaria brevicollis]
MDLCPTRLLVFLGTVVDAGGGRPMSNSGWACPELVCRPFRLLQRRSFSGIFCCDRVETTGRPPIRSTVSRVERPRGCFVEEYLAAVIPASGYVPSL